MTPSPRGRFFSSPNAVLRWRAKASSSTNEPSSRRGGALGKLDQELVLATFEVGELAGGRVQLGVLFELVGRGVIGLGHGPQRNESTPQGICESVLMPYDDLDRPPLDAGALRAALTGSGRSRPAAPTPTSSPRPAAEPPRARCTRRTCRSPGAVGSTARGPHLPARGSRCPCCSDPTRSPRRDGCGCRCWSAWPSMRPFASSGSSVV